MYSNERVFHLMIISENRTISHIICISSIYPLYAQALRRWSTRRANGTRSASRVAYAKQRSAPSRSFRASRRSTALAATKRSTPRDASSVIWWAFLETAIHIEKKNYVAVKPCFYNEYTFCNQIITSGGVTYKNEPWHRECFTCTNCSTSLAGQRFTSRDEKPYCAECFGELFAKRCTSCTKPITGKDIITC